ncbi:hypothetical protein F442_02093 [Phytophthora nicotianae P10297]|nr:hypothetical protein F442_02093 [Phytophthora nicotianae P10297]
MKIDIVRRTDDEGVATWHIIHGPISTTHNHPPSKEVSSHPVHCRSELSDKIRSHVVVQSQTGVRAVQTLAALRSDGSGTNLLARDIYNARHSATISSLCCL